MKQLLLARICYYKNRGSKQFKSTSADYYAKGNSRHLLVKKLKVCFLHPHYAYRLGCHKFKSYFSIISKKCSRVFGYGEHYKY